MLVIINYLNTAAASASVMASAMSAPAADQNWYYDTSAETEQAAFGLASLQVTTSSDNVTSTVSQDNGPVAATSSAAPAASSDAALSAAMAGWDAHDADLEDILSGLADETHPVSDADVDACLLDLV